MGFIQENANIKLFLLIVIVAGLAVALTVVYQQSYKDINQKYSSKLKELNQTFEQLTGTQSLLNKTKEDLELKEVREEDLTEQYTKIKKARDSLEADNNKLKVQLEQKEKKLQDLTGEVDKLKNDIETKNEEIEDMEQEVDSLKKQVSCLRAGNANC
ncbi:MAG TPA: hypothetical protein VJG30_00975 [Candidatus Nanoarchaeia archaeon]|nr:hypothetical protein [Candidatus Nanoarchaeia archaeon]